MARQNSSISARYVLRVPDAVEPVLDVPSGLPEGRLVAPFPLLLHGVNLFEQFHGDILWDST